MVRQVKMFNKVYNIPSVGDTYTLFPSIALLVTQKIFVNIFFIVDG